MFSGRGHRDLRPTSPMNYNRLITFLAIIGWMLLILQTFSSWNRKTDSLPPCSLDSICALPASIQHEAINFEPPAHNSLTGPRETPIVKGKKSLIAIPVGSRSKENLDKLITAFGLEKYTFMLFHYDMTDWSDKSWYKQVISIRVPGQMKWWYMKRFVTPQIAETYEFIYAVDEDSDPTQLDVDGYNGIIRRHNISVSQPSLSVLSTSKNHEVTYQQFHPDESIVGRWTDFVECGPFVVVTSLAWRSCVWDLIQEDLTSGWGLDILWHGYCKARAGIDRFAVIDKFPQIHLSFRTASSDPAAGKPKYDPFIEMQTFFDRHPTIKHAEMKTVSVIRDTSS